MTWKGPDIVGAFAAEKKTDEQRNERV